MKSVLSIPNLSVPGVGTALTLILTVFSVLTHGNVRFAGKVISWRKVLVLSVGLTAMSASQKVSVLRASIDTSTWK